MPSPVSIQPPPIERAAESAALPSFRSNAADQAMPGAASALAAVRARLRHAFAATQPVQDRSQLIGRRRELEALIAAISEQRAHALIFGPRGYGKTSLVRTFGELADQAQYVVVYTSCSHTTDFSSLFRPYLQEVPLDYSSRRNQPGLTGRTLGAAARAVQRPPARRGARHHRGLARHLHPRRI